MLEILISTMNRENVDILKEMNIKEKALIINQSKEKIEFYSKENIRMITMNEKGLSKSRNVALKNAKEEICIFSDDDAVYIDNLEKIIIQEFRNNPEYDILTFQVEGIEKKFKNYKGRESEIRYIASMKVSSIEIAFRRKSIVENKIKFNELLGSGAKYSMGEENEFLFKCLKKGLKIKYIPLKIANLHIGNSSWFTGFNKKYFIDRGAVFTAMNKQLSFFFIVQFAIRKYKIYKDKIKFNEAIKFMIKGRKMYLQDIGE